MNIISLILIMAITINLLLAIFVFLKNKKSLINIFFSITIAGAALWGFAVLFSLTSNINTIYFWDHFTYISIIFPIVSFLFFSFVFPYGQFPKNIYIKWTLFVSIFSLFIMVMIPDFLVTGYKLVDGKWAAILNYGYLVYLSFLSVYYIWAFINLNIKYKKSDGIVKSQLLYLSLGVFITFGTGIISNVIFYPTTEKYIWVGPASTIFLSGFAAYAITRYRLMDIKVVLRNSIVASLTLITLIIIFVTVTYFLLYVVASDVHPAVFMEIVIIFSLILLLTNPVKKRVTNIFNKLFFAPLYNKEIVLNKLAQKIPELLNIRELVDLIINTIQLGLQIEKISIWSIDTQQQEYTLLKTIGFKFKGRELWIRDADLMKYFLTYNDPVIYHEIDGILEDDNFSVHKKMFVGLKNKMEQNKLEVILPLIVKKDIIGIILLGRKTDGTSYAYEDIDTLKVIASHSAVALDNAGLYKETQQFAYKMEREVKRATSELMKVNKQLMKLDKAKSEFISIASHQLRTPLTVIKGYASMVLEGDYGKVNPEITPAVNSIFASSNRMSSLVENLLNVSRIESGKIVFNIKDIDFKVVVGNIVNEFGAIVNKKKLKLTYMYYGNNFHIQADEVKIREVVSNLIDNAVKYTEKGGIEIKLYSVLNGKGSVLLSVKDSGIGIDKEDSPYIFQKFRRGKKVALVYTDGLGLGMFFSQKIVEAHKGKIWVESAGADKGSTFFVELPM